MLSSVGVEVILSPTTHKKLFQIRVPVLMIKNIKHIKPNLDYTSPAL